MKTNGIAFGMRIIGRMAVLGVLALGLSGCATSVSEFVRNGFKVGPNYTAPPAPVPAKWIDEGNPRVKPGDPNLASWWEVFDDPILNDLLYKSYSQSLTVRAAAYQIMQAQMQRAIAVGQIFPQTQSLGFNGTHGLTSANGGFSSGGIGGVGIGLAPSTGAPNLGSSIGSSPAFGFSTGGRYFNNFSTNTNLSWELDFWGLFRRNLEAADASLDQSVYNCDEIVVMLLSNVATQYIQIRTLQKRLELARKNVALQEPIVAKLEKRFQAGAANSEPGYFQLKSNLENTRALIPPLESALRQANNQLCLLLGVPVRDMIPELGDGTVPDPANPGGRTVRIPRPRSEAVVVGIPGALLSRRPDVVAAEQALRNKSAQIGIAEAEMFPHLGLNGTIGLASNNISKLYNPTSWTGTIGPSLSWNILNYGRLLGSVRYQNYQFQQYLAQYQNTVLTANQEAENALIAYLQSLEQAKSLRESADAAARVTSYYFKQEKAGFLPGGIADSSAFYNQLFTTTNFQVSQQDAAAQAEGNIALNLVLIYRSLGGGWEIRENFGGVPNGGGRFRHHHRPNIAAPPVPVGPGVQLPAPAVPQMPQAVFGPPIPRDNAAAPR